jgi:peroxiredoxin
MKKLITIAALFISASAFAAKVNAPAPDFTATDWKGKTVSLADYKGKYVVLEWHNKGCPFVKKYYGSGAMQKLQKEWTGKDVVWLTVLSSAKGNEGYDNAAGAKADMTSSHASPTDVILDADGKVGHAYGAQTTPHMFVIDKSGNLIYNGAIDDKPTAEASDIPAATNYVSLALNESMAGKTLSHPTTKPYGCGVKY